MTRRILIRVAWETGIPLATSWEEYAAGREKRALNKLRQTNIASPSIGQNQESDVDVAAVGFSLLEQGLSHFSRRQSQADNMRSRLSANLQAGQLIAFGKRFKPSPSRAIFSIDADFWLSAEIDWRNSTAETRGFGYEEIRVLWRSALNHAKPDKVKMGAPTIEPSIREAIERAEYRYFDFAKMDRSLQIKMLRNLLEQLHGPEFFSKRGTSEKNLSRYLRLKYNN